MKPKNENIEVVSAKNQLRLFGFGNYFNSFIKLNDKKALPNSILLSGPKGLGKSTFAYHIINYLLSKNERGKYTVKDFVIDETNLSYKLLCTDVHPNFFLIENLKLEKEIKIDQIRSLLKFLNKSTYSRNLKIIMIDNFETLNLNSTNALLKSIEEPRDNIFFFLIHNSSCKILDTVKSRCTEFKIFFTEDKKKNIFNNLIKIYQSDFESNEFENNLYFDTPGNVLKYFLALNKANVNIEDNKLANILYLIEKYQNEKNQEILSFISLFIEKFYNNLCLTDNENTNTYLSNYTKILKQLDYMKRFNLDVKNTFIWIKDVLKNEAR